MTYVDELTAAERAWLRREQRRDERSFAEYTGLHAELRAEGAALLDPDDELSDVVSRVRARFPAALLTVSAPGGLRRLRPDPGRPVIGVPVPEGSIERVLAGLVDLHREALGGPLRAEPVALATPSSTC